MKIALPLRPRIPPSARWMLAAASLLLLTATLLGGTIRFLKNQTARLSEPMGSGVEIPILDRTFLTEFTRRVPR